MYETYHEDVEIVLVYIKEAHALDSRSPMEFGLIEDPVTVGERQHVAQTCVKDMGLDMIPAVMDQLDNLANEAYKGHPDRLFLVGKDGRIKYAAERGPWGFKVPDMVDAIDKELEAIKAEENSNDSN